MLNSGLQGPEIGKTDPQKVLFKYVHGVMRPFKILLRWIAYNGFGGLIGLKCLLLWSFGGVLAADWPGTLTKTCPNMRALMPQMLIYAALQEI